MSKATTFRERLQDFQRSIWSVSGQDRAVFMRCLSTTLGSGVGVDRSLDLLAEQTENRELAQACEGMAKLVRSGSYLSVAMSRFPWAFSNLQRRLVQVGERTGALVQVLNRLSIHEEKQMDMTLKIRSSLTMPIIVCILCIGLVIFIPPFLFKGLFQMLQDSHTALPWPTRILMTFSDLLRSWAFYGVFLLGIGGGVAFLYKAQRDRALRKKIMQFALSIPSLGKTLRLVTVTRFLQSMETMVKVGLPIMTCIELAGSSTDNPVLEDALKSAIEGVKQGDEINVALRLTNFFPLTVIHSVEVGEQSGKLGDMLESLSALYTVELDAAFETLAKSVEPLVLSIIGAIVGFTVIATMLPMVKLIQNL